jgi:Uncharacterized conserved protein
VLVRASELRLLDVSISSTAASSATSTIWTWTWKRAAFARCCCPGDGGRRGWSLFGRRPDIAVPWARVRKIGVDVILVHLPDTFDWHAQA